MNSKRINDSLKYSLMDGAFCSIMVGCTQDFFTPLLLLFGGTSIAVALLNSLPNLLSSLMQVKTASSVAKLGSRKKVILLSVLVQSVVLAALAFMIFMQGTSIFLIVCMVTLFTIAGTYYTPAWSSLMADLVLEKRRGAYFGLRNQIIRIVFLLSLLGAGYFLGCFSSANAYKGFAYLFGCACIFRLLSLYYIYRMYEPRNIEKESSFMAGIYRLCVNPEHRTFLRYTGFIGLFNFSVTLSSPFFSVYLLQELHTGIFLFTVLNVCMHLSIVFTIKRWGVLADTVGNKKVLFISAQMVSFLPLLWLVNQNTMYLFWLQVLSGFAWAGFIISSSNIIFDICDVQKRTEQIAYYNVINGLFTACGPLVGGALCKILPPMFGSELLSLFVISSFLRIITVFVIPFGFKDFQNNYSHLSSLSLLLRLLRLKQNPYGRT